jgi:hypothetical protein
MLHFRADMTGLRNAAKALGAVPAQINRARKSALSSTAYMSMHELRNHVEYGGTNWKPLHPLTKKLKGKSISAKSPLFNLAKWTRYRINKEGTFADIDFGKSRIGEPGTFDPEIVALVKRHDEGLRIPVSEKMRGWMPWISLPRKRRSIEPRRSKYPSKHALKPKMFVAGKDYFPLRKSTTHITIPARPIFAPVWRKIQPRLGPHFDGKFRAAIVRYLSGGIKT